MLQHTHIHTYNIQHTQVWLLYTNHIGLIEYDTYLYFYTQRKKGEGCRGFNNSGVSKREMDSKIGMVKTIVIFTTPKAAAAGSGRRHHHSKGGGN